jgi:uncharacterized protein (DUF4415 family)
MPKKTSDPSSLPDDDNPEWTPETSARARPAAEVLPQYISQPATDALLRRPPGRPPKENRKINQTLRLDTDVLDAYQDQGKGWQTIINDVLRRNMPVRR